MTLRIMINTVSVLLSIITITSCKKDSPTEPAIPVIGNILYVYQSPSTDNSHNFKIYSINADGSENNQIITSNMGLNMPRMSPDETKLAVLGYSGNNTSIYVYNSDGTNLKRLTAINEIMDMHPAWSPDGTKITFTRMLPAQEYRREIWIMNADGSNQRFFGEGFTSIWTNDGKKIIYSSNKSGNFELYSGNIDGTNEQKLTNTGRDESNPDLSFDGTKIVYTVSDGVLRGSEGTSDIWIMNVDGTGQRQLTNNNYYDGNPKWSADGLLFLFSSDQSAADHYETYVMNIDGTNVKRVTNTPGNSTAIYPAWRSTKLRYK